MIDDGEGGDVAEAGEQIGGVGRILDHFWIHLVVARHRILADAVPVLRPACWPDSQPVRLLVWLRYEAEFAAQCRPHD